MKKYIIKSLAILVLSVSVCSANAQESSPFKTTLDITINDVGSAICQVTNKYNASYWDYFTKTVGSNTSIINNQLKKAFPTYHLTEFKHSQDANERSNSATFKIDGMMNINKNGKWEAELDQKDPNITKLTEKDFLIIDGGQTIKLHLPAGTNDAKVEKNSFGKAVLTYTAKTSGGMGGILLYLGIALAIGGIALLVRNKMGTKTTAVAKAQSIQIPAEEEKIKAPSLDEISKN